MGNLLPIGLFADASLRSVKALRRYHEQGLLGPGPGPGADPSQYRTEVPAWSPYRPDHVAVALGATVTGEHNEYGVRWTVLHDPQGNEFCVAQRRPD